MKQLLALCAMVIACGLSGCGGAPSETSAVGESTDAAPRPTAVFSEDFETGEAKEWQAGGDSETPDHDAPTEEARDQGN